MARLLGASCGLLLFGAMVLRGLLAGNPIEVVISRALVGMFAGVALGAVIGWVAMMVVADNPPPAPEALAEAVPNTDRTKA